MTGFTMGSTGEEARWHGEKQASANRAPIPLDWPHRDLSRMVDAAGTSWHVQRAGSGPAMLLVHGTGASTHSWRDVLPRLAARFDVLAVDLPGHGYSGRLPDEAMSLPSLSDAIGRLLEVLEFRPRYVVGHSAGAAILLAMALDGRIRPDCVIGLNPALKPYGGLLHGAMATLTRWLASTQLVPRMLARQARRPAAVRRVLRGTGSTLDDAGVALYQRLLRSESHVASVLAMMASWDLTRLIERLPGLSSRLYLVTASGDRAVPPREVRDVARRLATTRIVELDEGGHLVHEEYPERVSSLIGDLCLGPGDEARRGR